MSGKTVRMNRILNPETGRTLTVPMDHSFYRGTSQLPSLANPVEIVKKLVAGNVDAIIVHRGIAKLVAGVLGKKTALIVKLTNTTVASPDPSYQALFSSVEDAIRLGADGISVQIDCRAEKEPEMLEILGMTAEACDHWGMPLVAMMYYVADEKTKAFDPDAIGHVTRIGSELGADIIKVSYTGNIDTFKKVVAGAGVPVVIAGGPKLPGTKEILTMVSDSLEAGGIGVSMGRNIFAHENPTKMAKALSMIIHEGASVDKAMAELG